MKLSKCSEGANCVSILSCGGEKEASRHHEVAAIEWYCPCISSVLITAHDIMKYEGETLGGLPIWYQRLTGRSHVIMLEITLSALLRHYKLSNM